MPTTELVITGKVQGVFYRGSARQIAEELGLTGWVKNMPDGSVVLRASGTTDALEQMTAWCRQGPPSARVTQVVSKTLSDESFAGFKIIR